MNRTGSVGAEAGNFNYRGKRNISEVDFFGKLINRRRGGRGKKFRLQNHDKGGFKFEKAGVGRAVPHADNQLFAAIFRK